MNRDRDDWEESYHDKGTEASVNHLQGVEGVAVLHLEQGESVKSKCFLSYQAAPGHDDKDEAKHREKNAKDADDSKTFGEVNGGPECKSSDNEDCDAGDAGGQQDGLAGVLDGDDADDEAVEGGHHTQQDDIEGKATSHLRKGSIIELRSFITHLLHLLVAAGHGKDDAEDGDVHQHGGKEPGIGIGPHLTSSIKIYTSPW